MRIASIRNRFPRLISIRRSFTICSASAFLPGLVFPTTHLIGRNCSFVRRIMLTFPANPYRTNRVNVNPTKGRYHNNRRASSVSVNVFTEFRLNSGWRVNGKILASAFGCNPGYWLCAIICAHFRRLAILASVNAYSSLFLQKSKVTDIRAKCV